MLTNKYSEGLPGARYYGGNEVSYYATSIDRG
jgi:glycine/serine hydroxymethyltransferase